MTDNNGKDEIMTNNNNQEVTNMDDINRFDGEFRFLSNFRPADVFGYPTNEHWFVANKCESAVFQEMVRAEANPSKAKRMGSFKGMKKLGFTLREDWDDVKDDVMLMGLREKFSHGSALGAKLMATGDAILIEGNNWHDTYWGVCDGTCRTPHTDPQGENILGKLLMQVREELNGKEKVMTDNKTKKEVIPMLYQFETTKQLVITKDDEEVVKTYMVQVATSKPTAMELACYDMHVTLAATNLDLIKIEDEIKKAHGKSFRVDQMGKGYSMPFLMGHVKKTMAMDFRMERFKISTRDEFGDRQVLLTDKDLDHLDLVIDKSTLAWATSTTLNVLYVLDHDGKVLTDTKKLGLNLGKDKKMSKRLSEVNRIAEMYELCDDLMGITVEVVDEHPLGVKARDGQSVIAYSFAERMIENIPNDGIRAQRKKELEAGKINSGIFRWFHPLLGKGDAVVAPDAQLKTKYGYVPDIVTDAENIKKAVSFNRAMATYTPHHGHHMPNLTVQAMSWSGELFATEKRLVDDFNSQVDEFSNAIKAGNFPKHLTNSAPTHNEDDLWKTGYMNTVNSTAERFVKGGMSIHHSTYLMTQLINGRVQKLMKDAAQLRMPMPWGAYVHVTTVAVLEMGNFDLSAYDTSKAFYHLETGRFCYPTQLFIDLYHRHGGWDLDDSLIVMLRLMEISECETLGLNPAIRITSPMNQKEYGLVAAGLRSPNGLSYFGEDEGPGEYSIFDVDVRMTFLVVGGIHIPVLNFPIYNIYRAMPTILAKHMPKVTHAQNLEFPDEDNLPNDGHILADEYNRDEAKRSLRLALMNPGIGSVINRLIAHVSIVGTYPKNLPMALEQMVDTLEQVPDAERFSIIKQLNKALDLWFKETNMPVSRFIARTRMAGVYSKGQVKNLVNDTKYDRMHKAVLAKIEELKTDWLRDGKKDPGLAYTLRKPIEELLAVSVSPEAIKVAKAVWQWHGDQTTNSQRKGKDGRTLPTQKPKRDLQGNLVRDINGQPIYAKDPYVAYSIRKYYITVTNECYDMIMESECSSVEVMAALYQLVYNGTKHTGSGKDNVLFQMPERGSNNGIFDLFMATLLAFGCLGGQSKLEQEDYEATSDLVDRALSLLWSKEGGSEPVEDTESIMDQLMAYVTEYDIDFDFES